MLQRRHGVDSLCLRTEFHWTSCAIGPLEKGSEIDKIGQLTVTDSSVNTEDRGYVYDAAWNVHPVRYFL